MADALSAGLNCGVGGRETSADDEEWDEVGIMSTSIGVSMGGGVARTVWFGNVKSIWEKIASSTANAELSDQPSP